MGAQITLCGGFEAELEGHRIEERLPGKQGRLLFAALVLNRARATSRDELIDALWPGQPPASPGEALSSLLSKLRQVVGSERLRGRSELTLVLPEEATVDFEHAGRALEAARSKLSSGEWGEAATLAGEALAIARLTFLPGIDSAWVEERRRELDEIRTGALEAVAEAGVGEGGSSLVDAERAAQELTASEPLRESGHRLLMEALAARGEKAQALSAYEALRLLLRDELGVAPSEAVRALQARILADEGGAAPPRSRPAERVGGRRELPALVARESSDLIGRDRDLESLRSAWRRACAGRRSFAAVGGEPGIGKTRLLAQLAREADGEGIVLYSACEEETSFAYQPLIEPLRQLVRAEPDLPELGTLVSAAPELARMIPELTGARAGAAEDEPADPEARRYRMFEAISALMSDSAAQAPVLLLLDDLHWADASSLRLLRHILRAQDEAAVLVVAAYRESEVVPGNPLSELLGDLRRDGFDQRISLRGLDREEVAALVASHAGYQPPAAFVADVHADTAGNPFFVTEIVRHAIETGAVGERGDRAERVGVPQTVQEVLARRLNRLSSECREVLARAAVIGREFDLDLLLASGSEDADEEEVIGALEEALGARLIAEGDGGLSYAFSHALVRQAIYEASSAPRRRLMHAAVAEAIERDAGPDRAAALATHWGEAGRMPEALSNALAAADAAEGLFAWSEALHHRAYAIEIWDRVPDAEERAGGDLADQLLRAAEDANLAVEPTMGIEFARRAIDLVDEGRSPLRAARLRERLGRYLWLEGHAEEADAVQRDAVALVRGLPDSADVAAVIAGQAQVLMLRGNAREALAGSERALEVARALGARAEESQALNTLGVCIGTLGDLDGAIEVLRDAKRIAEELGWIDPLVRAYMNLTVTHDRAGRVRESVDVALDGMRALGRLGASLGTTFLRNEAARGKVRVGEAEEARRILEDGEEPTFGLSAATRNTVLSELATLEGDLDEAIAAASRATDLFRDSHDSVFYGPALAAKLGALLASARIEEAAREFDGSIGLITGVPDVHFLSMAYARGVRACASAGGRFADRGRDAARDFAALLEPERFPRGAPPPRALACAATIEADLAELNGSPDGGLWDRAAELWAELDDAGALGAAPAVDLRASADRP